MNARSKHNASEKVQNQTSFNARGAIKDCGKCFSYIERIKLKEIAEQIGTKTDRIFIGTRKHDNINQATENHFKRTEGIVLSLVDNKVVDMRFGEENMFENIAQYLRTFSNEGHNYYQIKPKNIYETISDIKDQINL